MMQYLLLTLQENQRKIKKSLIQNPDRKVFTIDATKIALECIGRALPNASMLGAVCKVTGLVSLEHLLEDVRKSFGKKFPQKIIDGNVEETRRGHEEVTEG